MFVNNKLFITTGISILIFGAFFWFVGNNNTNTQKVKNKTTFLKKTGEIVTLNDLVSSNIPDTNITNDIISKYTKDILKLNKKGIGINSKITLPNEKSLDEIIQNKFKDGIPVQYFKNKDIRTSNDNSKNSVTEYIKNIQKIYQKNTNSKNNIGFVPSIEKYINTDNSSELQINLSLVSKQIDELLSMSVPSDWLDIHLKLINAWQKRFAIGTAIIQNDKDPLKATAAIREVYTLPKEENIILLSFQEKLKNL